MTMVSERKVVLIAIGTRPEAIKMAPLYLALKKNSLFDVKLIVTGQHAEMLDQVLEFFSITPDVNLRVASIVAGLSAITAEIITKMPEVFDMFKPIATLVHGDTATTLAVSVASYYRKISVYHVEAGLRTGNIYSPWPEEVNRRIAGVISNTHFAPTENAKANLLREGVDEKKIYVTGNTVIDALEIAKKIINDDDNLCSKYEKQFSIDRTKKLILVTGHRRESFGSGFERISDALSLISKRKDVYIIYPVHLNPSVSNVVRRRLKGHKNIFLISPVNYLEFVYLMMMSKLILTDSGGVQEEAPSLGKPVLVMRDTTERPEAVSAGTVALVGTSVDRIHKKVCSLLDDAVLYRKMSMAHNPYGDGRASSRIIDVLTSALGGN